jgi:hypothetical protein
VQKCTKHMIFISRAYLLMAQLSHSTSASAPLDSHQDPHPITAYYHPPRHNSGQRTRHPDSAAPAPAPASAGTSTACPEAATQGESSYGATRVPRCCDSLATLVRELTNCYECDYYLKDCISLPNRPPRRGRVG